MFNIMELKGQAVDSDAVSFRMIGPKEHGEKIIFESSQDQESFVYHAQWDGVYEWCFSSKSGREVSVRFDHNVGHKSLVTGSLAEGMGDLATAYSDVLSDAR